MGPVFKRMAQAAATREGSYIADINIEQKKYRHTETLTLHMHDKHTQTLSNSEATHSPTDLDTTHTMQLQSCIFAHINETCG
jgi:hypothetical protein